MKQGKKWLIIPALLVLISALACLAAGLNRDELIIYHGIGAFRTLMTVLQIAFICMAAVFLLCLLIAAVKGRKKEEPAPVTEESPALSIKERLDSESLRRMLSSEAQGRWSGLSPEIGCTISQLEKMDGYQVKLHSLLETNDVKALSDTEEILEHAEQKLCQNVRRILNYMNVYDEKDQEALRATVQMTNEKNQAQLDQVRDFVMAVTDFVNQQGTDDSDPDMLNTYKTVILDSLKEES